MTPPLVSVIVPAYDGGAMLREAVGSILAQDYRPLDVVVVDDGSEEDVATALGDLAAQVRIVRQPNAGTAAARNRGIREARGELIALLDQDDLWDPGKLSRQVPLFADAAVGLVHGGVRFVDTDGRVTSTLAGDPSLDVHALLASCEIAVQTVVMRRSALDSVGGFDVTLSAADDWDLWIRFAEHSRMAAIPEPLATVRVHEANQSRNAELMYRSARQLIAKHRHIHRRCVRCRRARWRASLSNRRSYYERRREQARSLRAAGRTGPAVRATARGLRRNPLALVTTPAHHAVRAVRGLRSRLHGAQ